MACEASRPSAEHGRRLSRGELGQNILARGGKSGGLASQTLSDAATAGGNAPAKRANISTTCRPQHEQFFAWPHRPQHQRRLGGRGRCGAGRSCRSAACRGRCSSAARGVDGLLTAAREFRLVLFQALQRRGAPGRHAGTVFLIVGATRAADRCNLGLARFFSRCAGRRLGGSRSRRCGGWGRLGVWRR